MQATATMEVTAPVPVKIEIHNDSGVDVKVQNILPPTIQIFPDEHADPEDATDGRKESEKIKINILF